MSVPYLASHPDGVLVTIWAVPGASRDEIGGLHDGALRVRTSSPPEAGRANRAVGRLVGRHLGAKVGEVVAGHSSRHKQVLVKGVTLQEAEQRVGAGG